MKTESEIPGEPRPPTFPDRPARGRELDTTKPPDDSLEGQMRELCAALKGVSELALRLETSLLQARIAIVTEEHQVHRAHERLDELAKRVAALEEAQAAE